MTPSDEDLEAKLRFIEAYFDDLGQKIIFLEELFRDDHNDEASLLCCCYIEGLGNHIYWPRSKCWENFVNILIEHGGDEIFEHIHPVQLKRVLEDPANSMLKIGRKIRDTLESTEKRLFSKGEIVELITPVLEESELRKLRTKLWKGTFAAVAYENFRNLHVHCLGGSDVSFGRTTFKGEPVPNMDFILLYRPLKSIFEIAKNISLESKKWFAHDFEQA